MVAKKTGISRNLLIHPGETIADILAERGISQTALATSTGVSPAFISNVINGKKDISASFAKGLEYALNVPASFWTNLQANYDAELLEVTINEGITDEERFARKELTEVIKYFQFNGNIQRDLSPEETILALRSSLRISNIANLKDVVPQGAFRMSGKQQADPLILGAWLRICQIANESVAVNQAFSLSRTSTLVDELKVLMLSCPAANLQESLRGLLASYGIAFSIVRHFKGAPVHGYVAKRDDGSFQMAMTIRDAWEDVFWFSLFHEIGHIHNGDVNSRAREYVDFGANEEQELRADGFAREALIDPKAYDAFLNQGLFTYAQIEQFACQQKVKPSIVIGRLQKEGLIPWNRFAKYKPRLKWAEGV